MTPALLIAIGSATTVLCSVLILACLLLSRNSNNLKK
jgi:hypothetical protein